MIKKSITSILILMTVSAIVLAEPLSDQEYINRLFYRNNKLEIVAKKRLIDEKKSYSYTNISSTTFSYEAYSDTSTNISTQNLSRAEMKEIDEWYIYLGGISELSDFDFLKLAGEEKELARITALEDQKARMRYIGNIFIGVGLTAMLGGAAASASQSIITGGALSMTGGFFLSAFNASPDHYIRPDYAQGKIDEYNIALKRKLNLPLQFE